jgi:small subunit ribosomal protein S9
MTTTAKEIYYYGTGKRKCAIARVRIYPGGGGTIVINGKPIEEVLTWLDWRKRVELLFDKIPAAANRFNVVAKIEGGGISAWADALRHGLARALLVADPTLKHDLRKHGYLTRDSRIKESKKYGLKRARRAPQYTKR